MVIPDLPGHLQRLASQVQEADISCLPQVDVSVEVLCVCFPACSIKQIDKYSQLILRSPSAADTGPYSCWVLICDGTECQKDQERTYVSYIYFTGHLTPSEYMLPALTLFSLF